MAPGTPGGAVPVTGLQEEQVAGGDPRQEAGGRDRGMVRGGGGEEVRRA